MAASTRFIGVLVRWNEDTSSGTLRGGDGIATPVHISEFVGGIRHPTVGAEYSFRRVLAAGRKGGWHARDVALINERIGPSATPRAAPRSRVRWQGVVIALAVDAVAAAAFVPLLRAGLPVWVPIIYAAASVVAFIMYAADKRAARLGQWRVSETTLQVLAVVGGWPGALLAQQVLRHKTRKASFQNAFWSVVLVNIFAFVVIFIGIPPLGIPPIFDAVSH
jgi:uncharacterized membrane protein YsdA (DUF1294 family)